MDLVTIVSTVNALARAVGSLGWNLSEVAALQREAASEGRELSIEDFRKLRDGAREKLDKLDAAIADAEAAEDGSATPPQPDAD